MEDSYTQSGRWFIQVKDGEIHSNLPENNTKEFFSKIEKTLEEENVNFDFSEIKTALPEYFKKRGPVGRMTQEEKNRINRPL